MKYRLLNAFYPFEIVSSESPPPMMVRYQLNSFYSMRAILWTVVKYILDRAVTLSPSHACTCVILILFRFHRETPAECGGPGQGRGKEEAV